MKVVIDTNIWISFLLGKSFRNLLDFIDENDIKVFTTEKQINELIKTINKPKINKNVTSEDITNLIFLFRYNFKYVNISNKLKYLRDPEDDYLIEIAIESNSKYIITGDKDLLDVKNYKNIKFITFREFEKYFE